MVSWGTKTCHTYDKSIRKKLRTSHRKYTAVAMSRVAGPLFHPNLSSRPRPLRLAAIDCGRNTVSVLPSSWSCAVITQDYPKLVMSNVETGRFRAEHNTISANYSTHLFEGLKIRWRVLNHSLLSHLVIPVVQSTFTGRSAH